MTYELRRRIAITVVSIAASRVLFQVPVPFLDVAAWREWFDLGRAGMPLLSPRRGSFGGLGILPYVSAAALLSFFRAIRHPDGAGAGPRERHVVVLATGLALVQGCAVGVYLENRTLVAHPGGLFLLTTALAYAAGVLATLTLAHVITARGIGNGVCLLAGTELLGWTVDAVGVIPGRTLDTLARGAIPLAVLLTAAWLALAAPLLGGQWSMAVRDPRGGEPRRLHLRIAGVGTAGMSLAHTLVALPGVLAGFLPPASPAATLLRWIGTSGLVGGILFVGLAFIGTGLFTAWAYAPRRLVRILTGTLGSSNDAQSALDTAGYQERLARTVLPVAVLVPAAIALSWNVTGSLGIVAPHPLTLLVLAAIVLDTRRQWRLHRHMAEALVPVPGDDPDRLRCPTCGAWSRDGQDACPACGAELRPGASCDAHPGAACTGRCVICRRMLCEDCRWSYMGRSVCEAHHDVPLVEGWAIVATPATTVEADLLRQRLEAQGLAPVVLVNTVAPYYGSFGMYEIGRLTPLVMHPECGGGGIELLVRPEEWEAARGLLVAGAGEAA